MAGPLAARLRDSRASLTLRWLERTAARVTVGPDEVFPTQDLLDHVPLLVEAIADYMENPAEEGPSADRVIAKAAQLGQLRFEQGFSPFQILKEFEILGSILLAHLSRSADEIVMDCSPGEYLLCAQRVHRALAMIQQATAARYLAMLEMQASEREQRLRALDDILSGPLGQRLDEVIESARALDSGAAPDAAAHHTLRSRLERVAVAIEQLRMLSSIVPSSRMQRNVPLDAAVAEAIRTLRHFAAERGIEIRVPEPLPEMEVHAGAVELALLVFLTTLLRHGVPTGGPRWIEVLALAESVADRGSIRLCVRDVGARMPEDAELASPADGVDPGESADDAGVSLDIARESIEALGGRIGMQVDPSTQATEFVLELPSRRAEDAAR